MGMRELPPPAPCGGDPDARLRAALVRAARRRSLERLKADLASLKPPLAAEAMEAARRAAELEQIARARSLERARYYVQRLQRSLDEPRYAPHSDLDLNRWKAYGDIWTDSWWAIPKRDRSSSHMGDYWGNFVPQIPHQLMRRFTRPGEWVLDPFAGSGTTLIECRSLGRHGLAHELDPKVVALARRRVAAAANPYDVQTVVVQGDSTTADFAALLSAAGGRSAHLAILHPPYHDIIVFGDDARNLSRAPDVTSFYAALAAVAERVLEVLEPQRYLALVIGDKYSGGEWVPLGFESMAVLQRLGLRLKSTIVKNFEATAGKRGQEELWRYRALAGGFYVFKHEYIFLMQKP